MPSLSLSLWNRHHPQTYFQQDKKKPKTQSLTDPKLDGVSESKALDLLEPQAMPAAYNNNDGDEETTNVPSPVIQVNHYLHPLHSYKEEPFFISISLSLSLSICVLSWFCALAFHNGKDGNYYLPPWSFTLPGFPQSTWGWYTAHQCFVSFLFYFPLPFNIFWIGLGLRWEKRNGGWLWIGDYNCW